MTAKEQAKELYDKMDEQVRKGSFDGWYDEGITKECALICANKFLDFMNNLIITEGSVAYKYWQDVKKQIELL